MPDTDIKSVYTIHDNGVPVLTVRGWTSALSPNPAGDGWNFITQAHQIHDSNPTEWTIIHLEAGTYDRWLAPINAMDDRLSSTSTATTHQQLTYKNQLMATNGRIFFPESFNNMAYYEPTDGTMHQLPFVVDLTNTVIIGGYPVQNDAIPYGHVFGPDGILYCGTQSNFLPAIFSVDPVTLTQTLIAHVGFARVGYSYAYYMAVDTNTATKYCYIAVGKSPWELVALNLTTGVQTLLATRPSTGVMAFSFKPEGIVVQMGTGVTDSWWLIDGALAQRYVTGYTVPSLTFTPRSVAPAVGTLTLPPNIDDSGGVPQVKWQANGSDPVNDPWNTVFYTVSNETPIIIESLTALPDGTCMGGTQQYSGFFRYDPATDATTWYGVLVGNNGISQGDRLVTPDGMMYICGYPQSRLLRFNPANQWISLTNPILVGNYGGSGAKYNYYLAYCHANNRLYSAGRREREGQGGGVGWNNVGTTTFGGTYANLNFLNPSGFAVVESINRVVFSGNVIDDPSFPGQTPTTAQLVVYDLNLAEVGRQTVIDGLLDTGRLFTSSITGRIMGLNSAGLMYQYDLINQRLISSQQLQLDVGPLAQDPLVSGSLVYAMLGGDLWTINPDNMVLTPVAPYPSSGYAPSFDRLAISSGNLWGSVGSELYSIFRTVPPSR